MSAIQYRRSSTVDEIPPDRHAVIEASAGTGKTFTLEHLVVRLVLEGRAEIDQILAVTFTEKATGDLRRRIRERFDKVLTGHGADNPDDGQLVTVDEDGRQRLERALFSFHLAPVHTIHSFCQRTLTEIAFLTGTPFRPEVTDAREAFEEAFRAELRDNFAKDASGKALLEEWLTTERETSGLGDLLFEAHRNRYLATRTPERAQTAIKSLLDTFDIARLRRDYDEAAINKSSREKAHAAFDQIAEALAAAKRDEFALIRALGKVDFQPIVGPTSIKTGKRFPDELSEKTRRFIDAATIAGDALPLEVRIADAFLPATTDRMERQKRQRGVMDYDDMLSWLARALDGPSGAAIVTLLRQRYRYAIIDEFQDTDDVQWKIFERIFIDGAPKNFVYVIGDPKQAIYSFRGADVYAYLNACKQLSKIGATKARLAKSYRSTPAMIERLNLIFDANGQSAILSGDFAAESGLEAGKPNLKAVDGNGKDIAPVTLMDYRPARDSGDGSAVVRRRLGRYIAATLRKMLFDDKHRITIVNSDDTHCPKRCVKPRDVFILTRKRAEADEIGEYLREAGVPYAFYKRDGLFQTPEAGDVLDVLRAVADPAIRSNRLKAWASPFFAVPHRELIRLGDVDGSHPLMARLLEWHSLANTERFAELFNALLHQSGLAFRELFLANSERELTNYQHILELLLDQALRQRLNTTELADLLAAYIYERADPPGTDGNVQRLESERDAVQIMTIHMSKGLEADVVFIYSGVGLPKENDRAVAYHDPKTGERMVAVGKAAIAIFGKTIKSERDDEERRLAYVALTRARAKLYVPRLPEDSPKKQYLSKYYRAVNERLSAILDDEQKLPASKRLFELESTGIRAPKLETGDLDTALKSWKPDARLFEDDRTIDGELASLRSKRRALEVLSYTALDRIAALTAGDSEREDYKIGVDESQPIPAMVDLPGGRNVGIFLHEIIEGADLGVLNNSASAMDWAANPKVQRLIESAARRNYVTDSRWVPRAAQIVFDTLRTPIALPTGTTIPALGGCQNSREMEFTFPIPELDQPVFSNMDASDKERWRIERGVFLGYVDFIFRHQGRTYFADWKSDLLPSYDSETIAAHVSRNYRLQAVIYTVGVVRLLGIRTEEEYEQRFGGLLYVFLRGMTPSGGGQAGVYFHRPDSREILAYTGQLIDYEHAARGEQ